MIGARWGPGETTGRPDDGGMGEDDRRAGSPGEREARGRAVFAEQLGCGTGKGNIAKC